MNVGFSAVHCGSFPVMSNVSVHFCLFYSNNSLVVRKNFPDPLSLNKYKENKRIVLDLGVM